MALILDVDGEKTENPDSKQIADGFRSIDPEQAGFHAGTGISMVVLIKDEANSITATGHPSEGFSLSFEEGEQDVVYETKRLEFLPMDEVVAIFQAYARGEDWGKDRFQWERSDYRQSKVAKIIIFIVIGGFFTYLAFWALRAMLPK